MAAIVLAGIATLMVPITLLFVVHSATGSFGVAGLVSGGNSLGFVATGPLRGRLVDVWGARIALRVLAVLWMAPLEAVAVGVSGTGALAVMAALSGAGTPPLLQVLRSAWGRALDDPAALNAAYSLQAAATELMFVAGPLLGGLAVAASTPRFALAIAAAAGVTATFASTQSSLPQQPSSAPKSHASVMRSHGLRTLALSSLGFGTMFGALDVAIPAFTNGRGGAAGAGALLGLLATGSFLAALAHGALRPRGKPGNRYLIACIAIAITLVPLPLSRSVVLIAVLLGLAGLAVAPMTTSLYTLLDLVVAPTAAVEAMSWIVTLYAVGTTAGNAAAGAALQLNGLTLALSLPALAAALGALIAFAGVAALSEPAPEPTSV